MEEPAGGKETKERLVVRSRTPALREGEGTQTPTPSRRRQQLTRIERAIRASGKGGREMGRGEGGTTNRKGEGGGAKARETAALAPQTAA